MFTHKDIEYRTIFVINCIKDRNLRVSGGELLLEEQIEDSDKQKTLTKLPFQKILALFVIGHITITTPLLEKCQKFGVALVVMKPNLRPVFYWANSAEANFLLHQKQYFFNKNDISIAKQIVSNKIKNQIQALDDTRKKDDLTSKARKSLLLCLELTPSITDYNILMGVEGTAAKSYFQAMFQDYDWHQRRPRTRCDALNSTLDIGYTILFNFVECYLRMFGFDLYVGVYHRLWFRRKSLVCDIMEPLRPIIDKAVRTGWNRNQFREKDFQVQKGEYLLKHDCTGTYYQVFFNALIPYKTAIFKYIQSYYRCFMGQKAISQYPIFSL